MDPGSLVFLDIAVGAGALIILHRCDKRRRGRMTPKALAEKESDEQTW